VLPAALAASALIAAAPLSRAATLLDGAADPLMQGWLPVSNPSGTGTYYTVGEDGLTLDTLADEGIASVLATVPTTVTLDAAAGYELRFRLKLNEETHAGTNGDNRAGFSLTAIGSATDKSIELAFREDAIFAQNYNSAAATAFGFAEGQAHDTASDFNNYVLKVAGNVYVLYADIDTGDGAALEKIVSGKLRDYTGYVTDGDPYAVANMLYLGDNTTSASASVTLGTVSLDTLTASGQLIADGTSQTATDGDVFSNSTGPATWHALNGGSITAADASILINSTGDSVHGIQVDGATSNVAISDAVTISTAGAGSHGVYLTDGGQFSVGDLTLVTSGANSHGIAATITDANSAESIVIDTGDKGAIDILANGGNGIYVDNRGKGDVTITTAADITTQNTYAIATAAIIPADVKITSSGILRGAGGILVGDGYAGYGALGDVDIRVSGEIYATGGYGIQVHHDWSAQGADPVNINVTVDNGKISTIGQNASPLRIYSGAVAGQLNIELINPALDYENTVASNGALHGGISYNFGAPEDTVSTMDGYIKTTGGHITITNGMGISYTVETAGTGNLALENNGTTITGTGGMSLSHRGTSGNLYLASDADIIVKSTATSGSGYGILMGAAANAATNVFLGYDKDGGEKPVTGTITVEGAGNAVRTGTELHSTSNTRILAKDLVIKAGTLTPNTSQGSGNQNVNFGLTAYTNGTGDIHINYTGGSIETWGHYGRGFDIRKQGDASGDIVLESSAPITTHGNSAHGIFLGDNSHTQGSGGYTDGEVNVVLAQNGDITTAGSSSSAIYTNASSNATTASIRLGYKEDGEGGGYIETPLTGDYRTTGATSPGIYATGANKASIHIRNAADITTTNTNSHGLYIGNATLLDIVNTGDITTANATSSALYVDNNNASMTGGIIRNSGKLENTATGGKAVDLLARNTRLELLEGSELTGNVSIRGTGTNTLAIGVTRQTINGALTSDVAGNTLEIGFDETTFGQLTAGTVTLTNFALGFADLTGGGDAWTADYILLIEATNLVSGTFIGLADGAALTVGGADYTINYTGTTVYLAVAVSAVPEPATCAVLAGLAILACAALRRRNRN
jgi:hypothetical protein